MDPFIAGAVARVGKGTAEQLGENHSRHQAIEFAGALGDPVGYNSAKKLRAAAFVTGCAILVGGGLQGCRMTIDALRDTPGHVAGDVPRSIGEGIGDGIAGVGEGIGTFIDEAAPESAIIDGEALVGGITFPIDEQPLVRGDITVVSGGTKKRGGIGFATGYTVRATGEGSQLLKVLNGKEAFKTTTIVDREYIDETGAPAQDEHLRTEVDITQLRATLEDYVPTPEYTEEIGSKAWSFFDNDDPKRKAAIGHNIGVATTCSTVLRLFLTDAVERVVDARLMSSETLDSPQEKEYMAKLTEQDMDVVFIDAGGEEVNITEVAIPNTVDDPRVLTNEEFAAAIDVNLEDLYGTTFNGDGNKCSMSQQALEDTINSIKSPTPLASPSPTIRSNFDLSNNPYGNIE